MSAREQADQVADRVRDDLLTTLEELDRRRMRATDWKLQLQKHRKEILIAASVVAGAAVLLVGGLITRRRVAERRLVKRRLAGLRRAWQHPERIATKADAAPPWRELARKALVAFGAALAARAAKQAAAALIPEPSKRQKGEPYLH